MDLLYPHEVEEAGESPPAAPVRIVDAAGHATRLEYHADGRLKSVLLPGRSTDQQWRLDYYPDQLDSYFRGKRRLWKITDPTGKSIEITRYDALGRPQRVEVRPTRETLLWQETEWNTLGLPTTIRWSDGSSITLGWSQGAPAYVQDAAGR